MATINSSNTTSPPSYDPHFVAALNQQDYYFHIIISNGDKKSAPIKIPYYMVEELRIDETLFDWNVTGYLILKNEYEFLERGFIKGDANNSLLSTLNTSSNIGTNRSPYTFRHDGRNKINIRIFPLIERDGLKKVTPFNPEITEMNYDFVVYSVEDVVVDDLSKKRKKLYFWDERYQHFLERNIQWSTYYVQAEAQKTTNNIIDRKCKVGAAIKHLIETACGEKAINSANSKPLKVGWPPENTEGVGSYFNNASINNPSLNVASFDNTLWDDGPEENTIFYTSPATYNIIDDLDYLLKYYVSGLEIKDNKSTGLGMPGLLRLSRFTKQWQLFGIDQLYNKTSSNQTSSKTTSQLIANSTTTAGADVIESIKIQMQDTSMFGSRKTPTFAGTGENFTSTILSYRFVGMENIDDFSFNNMPVINYNTDISAWNIFFEDNTPDNAKALLNTTFLPKTHSNKDNKAGSLISLNKDKLNGLNTVPIHSVAQVPSVKVSARNSMIYKGIFLNQALEFTSLGATARTPGKFIAIDRSNNISVDNNDFENKFLGMWLLIKVSHVFTGDKYLNNTIGVKFNSYNELSTFKPENDQFNE